jgi:hypothetical protein
VLAGRKLDHGFGLSFAEELVFLRLIDRYDRWKKARVSRAAARTSAATRSVPNSLIGKLRPVPQ